MQNMDSSDDAGLIYTAGVGLGIKWIQIECICIEAEKLNSGSSERQLMLDYCLEPGKIDSL